ncbi:MAG: M23 family metallopeptidase [Deltaproteobacteria bacterium]|nr:M23 family metallopeptidase [Deltaproteobacteria bacterium]
MKRRPAIWSPAPKRSGLACRFGVSFFGDSFFGVSFLVLSLASLGVLFGAESARAATPAHSARGHAARDNSTQRVLSPSDATRSARRGTPGPRSPIRRAIEGGPSDGAAVPFADFAEDGDFGRALIGHCIGAVDDRQIRETPVYPDDNIWSALRRLGVRGTALRRAATALQRSRTGPELDVGEHVRVKFDDRRRLAWARYRDANIEYCAERQDNGTFAVKVHPLEMTTDIDLVTGEVQASLFDGMQNVGERPALALIMAELFAADPDLLAHAEPTDTFRILVEKKRIGGEFYRYGKILAAQYNRRNQPIFRSFYYQDTAGHAGYYDDGGHALPLHDLPSPIRLAVITSGYGLRRHPILGFTRAHQGVDYAAPRGTPIVAVLDGKVLFQRMHPNFGRLIALQHANGLVTRCAHMERFVRTLHDGDEVEAGEIIGFVGQSGLATGPHLHFETVVDGEHVNPLSISAPAAAPLDTAADRERFTAHAAELLNLLDPSSRLFAVVPPGVSGT